jgi:hypothetical protein
MIDSMENLARKTRCATLRHHGYRTRSPASAAPDALFCFKLMVNGILGGANPAIPT